MRRGRCACLRASELAIRNRRSVIILWVVVTLALTPVLLSYGHYISYSVGPSSLNDSESAKAQQALLPVAPANSTLVVVYQPGINQSASEIENRTFAFQRALNGSNIPYFSGSTSVFSSYEVFLRQVLTPSVVNSIRTTYYNFTSLAAQVYGFPSAFLGNWSHYGFAEVSISQAAASASYTGSPYESLFLKDLNKTYAFSPSADPVARVQNATATAALEAFFPTSPFLIFSVVNSPGYNITNYRSNPLDPVSSYLTGYSGFPISTEIVESALLAGDGAGEYYFSHYGLLGVPSFISQSHVSPDNTTYLVDVSFNVTEGFRGPNDFYPAQNATFAVRNLAQEYLGNAVVTGQGAVAADTAQISASAGYAFGLIFVFLAIAVGLLFSSYLPPILVLVVVSLATALGYVAIFVTGVILGSVDSVVTYVLTAVVLGVSTDYFVFMLSRYREELRRGRSSTDALSVAASRGSFAIIVSGVTVALGLGTISLVSGLGSWGPVLLIAILLTVVMEITLVPSALSLLGPRVFARPRFRSRGTNSPVTPTLRPDPGSKRSVFRRVVGFSRRRKFLVVGTMFLLAVPSTYLWLTLPTTYNINEGLSQSIPSVHALNLVEQKFGSNLIFPTFVEVSFPQNASAGGGALTPQADAALENDARSLLATDGVKQVIGPTINGTRVQSTRLDSQFVFNHGLSAYFIVFTQYDPYSASAISVVSQLRQNGSFLVGGLTSGIIDQRDYYNGAFAQLEVVILVVIGLILGLSFRSLRYPLIALSGVFIGITWTTAILYLVSTYLLGVQLVFLIPIVLFVILMSLGNDFAVFILSRVREEQKTASFEEGLTKAMTESGATVTALGLILAASLGSLGLVPFGYLEQLGLAFVVALVLDTFVIRTLYFPSTLFILGGRQEEPGNSVRGTGGAGPTRQESRKSDLER